MAADKNLELVRKAWKLGALVVAMTGPLIKACDFLTKHKLVTFEPMMSHDPLTVILNSLLFTAYVTLAAVLGSMFAVFLLAYRLPGFLNAIATAVQLLIAWVLWRHYSGLWWAEIGTILLIVTSPQRWMSKVQGMLNSEVTKLTLTAFLIPLEGIALAIFLAGANGFDSFHFKPLSQFDAPDFLGAAFGALFYGFMFWGFNLLVLGKSPLD